MPLPVPLSHWLDEWGVDLDAREAGAGGLRPPVAPAPPRQIYLLQRKTTKMGAGLGKTSGWVHRATLQRHGVQMLTGVEYRRIDDAGLHITQDGKERVLEVDHIVVCAGQDALAGADAGHSLDSADAAGPQFHLIGGAKLAAELDAKRAIREGAELAARL